jgi:hypothetical protein
MKIRPVGDEFYANGRTDRHEDTTNLISPFRNFANAPKDRREAVYSLTSKEGRKLAG